MAKKFKNLIISTGMAYEEDIIQLILSNLMKRKK